MSRVFDRQRKNPRRRNQQKGWLTKMRGFFGNQRDGRRDQEVQLKAELKRVRKSREEHKKAYKADAGYVEGGAFKPINRASLDHHSRYRRRNYYQICFYTLGVLILLGFIGSIYYRYVL